MDTQESLCNSQDSLNAVIAVGSNVLQIFHIKTVLLS